jgi:hypothetical protein
MALGIGQASNRNWQREHYKRDPEFRAKVLKNVADYTEKQIRNDPEYLRLRSVRATICTVRKQIDAHERRITRLNEKLRRLVDEKIAIEARRKERKCPTQ